MFFFFWMSPLFSLFKKCNLILRKHCCHFFFFFLWDYNNKTEILHCHHSLFLVFVLFVSFFCFFFSLLLFSLLPQKNKWGCWCYIDERSTPPPTSFTLHKHFQKYNFRCCKDIFFSVNLNLTNLDQSNCMT